MSTPPLVSVCIPVYNGELYLAETIRSVLAQTYSNFELIIVDNASTDGTSAISHSFQDPRIRIVRNSSLLTVEDNFNRAIAETQGEFIKLLCADDLIYPSCLEGQAAVLLDPKNAGVSLVACRRDVISEDSRVILKSRGLPGLEGERTLGEVLQRIFRVAGTNPIGEPCVALFRRSAMPTGKCFDMKFPFLVDLDFWLKLLQRGTFYGQDETQAAFRVTLSSCSFKMANTQTSQSRDFLAEVAERFVGIFTAPSRVMIHFSTYCVTMLRQVIYLYLRLRS